MGREGPGACREQNELFEQVIMSTSIYQDKTYVMPERDRLALVQQPNPPVQSVTSSDFPQTDSAVVEFAIVSSVVRASGSLPFVAARSLGRRWWSRRLRKARRLW